MAPTTPTLDVFILTFNCGKAPIDTRVFAGHLATALRQRRQGQDGPDPQTPAGLLPDLVVFSLQEVSPLSCAFIGPYFLQPYLARFEEALNVAAARLLGPDGAAARGGSDGRRGDGATDNDGSSGSGSGSRLRGQDRSSEQAGEEAAQPLMAQQDDRSDVTRAHGNQQQQQQPYTLVRAHNVGMTAMLLLARDPAAVRRVDVAECGFGSADMGNKGAVGLRIAYGAQRRGRERQQQQVTGMGDLEGEEGVGGEGGEEEEEEKGERRGKEGGRGSRGGATTELTFVAAHLAAMEWNCAKRNANWRAIVSGLTFTNPRNALPGVFAADTAAPQPDRSGRGDLRPPSSAGGEERQGREMDGLNGRRAGGQQEEREQRGDDDEEEEDWEQQVQGRGGGGGRNGKKRRKNRVSTSLESEDAQPLLPPTTNRAASRQTPGESASASASAIPTALTLTQKAALHDLSIFKPSAAYLFVAGDFNYRTSSRPPPLPGTAGADVFPASDADPHKYAQLLGRDQLAQERAAGRTFHGLTEAPIAFGPTYKFAVLPARGVKRSGARREEEGGQQLRGNGETEGEEEGEEEEEVQWRWSRHRWPSWCDRVLYMGLPAWMADTAAAAAAGGASSSSSNSRSNKHGPVDAVDVLAYDSLPVVRTSDHRAVFFRARVPLVGKVHMPPPPPSSATRASQLAQGQDGGGGGGGGGEPGSAGMVAAGADPRVELPFPVDVHAWERRAAARRREVVVGWSALMLSTREGAAVLAGMLMLITGVVWWAWGGGAVVMSLPRDVQRGGA